MTMSCEQDSFPTLILTEKKNKEIFEEKGKKNIPNERPAWKQRKER